MHGLMNKALQGFCTDAYGADTWTRVMRLSGTGLDGFEAMLSYDDDVTPAVLGAMAQVLRKPRAEVLEDMGTYLVSHPNTQALRRLLRFGGETFAEFLNSLDDLPDRARLALPDLELPRLELWELRPNEFRLEVTSPLAGFGHICVGMLRAMADDYGALVFLEHAGRSGETETIEVRLIESRFAEGRRFHLVAS
ncbi:heme NO-binding domain-containing protein [Pseudaestuariivita sp.]|uniref:heme NO-binding domain-containing protein n=1 Tax=Pseudaestuariivita sp. TaxID=2211669 RepID=UPI004058A12F